MGVKDLWKVLRPAASTQSVTRLAVDGFNVNLDGNRGYRVGIDASIWFGHLEKIKGRQRMGKNYALRTLFFRCTHMLEVSILPLFVFDGSSRPLVKRGKKSHFKESKLVEGMQELITAFGFQWHPAPGEAEAELAYLNRIGVIDAVWSDDVDSLLFGATTVIRNPSSTLSGNTAHPIVNAEGKDDGKHVLVINASDVESHNDIQLDRGGLVLIALLRGGDYGPGVPQIGIQIAHGLARCGFGASLATGMQSLDKRALSGFLASWGADIVAELRSNSRGLLGKKHAKLAATFPHDFPDPQIVAAYLSPTVSASNEALSQLDWQCKLNIPMLAEVCARRLDWDGDEVLRRFKSLVWPGAVLRVLRDAVLYGQHGPVLRNAGEGDAESSSMNPMPASSTPALASLAITIRSRRKHASTDYLPEWQLEVDPACFTQSAMDGLHGSYQHSPAPTTTQPSDADTHLARGGRRGRDLLAQASSGSAAVSERSAAFRVWLPACIVQLAVPQLSSDDENGRAMRLAKKRYRGGQPVLENEATKPVGNGTSRKKARSDANQPLQGRDSTALQRAQSPIIRLADTSESDVIVISDSDDGVAEGDGKGSAKLRAAVIDLT